MGLFIKRTIELDLVASGGDVAHCILLNIRPKNMTGSL